MTVALRAIGYAPYLKSIGKQLISVRTTRAKKKKKVNGTYGTEKDQRGLEVVAEADQQQRPEEMENSGRNIHSVYYIALL
jgi:hypothetical protein